MYPALSNYGHFTAMQVRDRQVRGLDLHLTRLDTATRELFDLGLDGGLVRAYIRHALADDVRDASVRAYVFRPPGAAEVSVTISVADPVAHPHQPLRLQSVPYQRPAAHIKHLGGFGQTYYGLRAERNGFDDALLTGPDGLIAEGAIANIGFLDGATIVWPDAPYLRGITMQLVERGLAAAGVAAARRTVRLADLPAYDGAFLTNSHGIVAVAAVDDLALPVDPDRLRPVAAGYDAAPWDTV